MPDNIRYAYIITVCIEDRGAIYFQRLLGLLAQVVVVVLLRLVYILFQLLFFFGRERNCPYRAGIDCPHQFFVINWFVDCFERSLLVLNLK